MAAKPEIPTTAATPEVAVKPSPRLGDQVNVQVAPGAVLINNETGQPFEGGKTTPQIVTVTVLRRLADGDLVLV